MFEASSHMPSTVVSRRDLSLGFASLPPIDVQKIWSVLWRGKITILLSMMIAVGLAAAFVLLVPHKYTATTQILIDPMDLRGAAQSDISPTIPQSDAAVLQVESQARVIASDNVLRRVVDSEGLDHDPEFMHGAMAQKYGPLAALNELQKHVQVKRSERTYVVDVSVTSEDPAKAARLANAIAQTYLTEQTEVRSNAARQISQALTGRLKELQTRVRDAEQKVEAYKASHNIVGANGELVNEQQLTELELPAQLGARAHFGSEGASRPGRKRAAFENADRRLPGGGAVADHHHVAQPICRDHAPRRRAKILARRTSPRGHRDRGAGRAAAEADRRRGQPHRAVRPRRIRARQSRRGHAVAPGRCAQEHRGQHQ